METAKKQNSCVLIESTANQVDQNGGYSGMTPKDFYEFCLQEAENAGLDKDRVFLGGDHLGPLTVTSFPAATSTVTPAGTVISLFPIRDITFYPPIYLLPNVSNNFST